MHTEIFDRLRREIAITVGSARETVLAIADRVNRKTQAVKLHWHAAELTRQIAVAHQEVGAAVSETLAGRDQQPAGQEITVPVQLQAGLEELSVTLRLLKVELAQIDRRIMEIEAETLSDDLLRFQLDLTGRALSIERLTVVPDAPAIGRSLDQLSLSPDARVIAVFRGPALLGGHVTEGLRAGDLVLLLGSRLHLQQDRLQFTQRQRATA